MTTPPKYEDLVLKVAELERREAALLEEMAALRESYEAMRDRKNSIVDLQQRLTVAEQWAADLKKLLCDVINEAPTGFASLKVDLANRVNDALNPAGHPQCEECKGWGYHENHHEGGGTECGECGGSGNATVAVAVVKPDVDELAQIIRKVDGSHTLGAGSLAEAILEEVARLNGVKP